MFSALKKNFIWLLRSQLRHAESSSWLVKSLLHHKGSLVEVHDSLVVMHRLRCFLACGILVPLPRVEPASSALQGRFLATRRPGKSLVLLKIIFHLSTALDASHKFWCFCFQFTIFFHSFLWFVFRIMWFSFQIFGRFSRYLYIIDFYFNFIVIREIFLGNFHSFTFIETWLMAQNKAYFNNIPCALEKKVYSAVLGGVPDSSAGKESACNAGDLGLIPGSGNSPGEGIGCHSSVLGLPCGSAGKKSTCNAADLGLIPGSGRSPGGGYGNPLQYSCLKNLQSMGLQRVRPDWD